MAVSESRHRFKLGQLVSLTPGFGYPRGSNVVYKIIALLPQDRTYFHYRLHSVGEAFDRVAAENELTARDL